MPPYSRDALSDLELAAIERYIRSFPESKTPNEIPLLARYAKLDAVNVPPSAPPSRKIANTSATARGVASIEEGAKIYASHCAICHGEDRAGGIAPQLLGENLKRDLSATIALLKTPPVGMPKLFPAPLSTEDLEAVATYIRTSK
jgi:mono/diheme cytochrome c family protein